MGRLRPRGRASIAGEATGSRGSRQKSLGGPAPTYVRGNVDTSEVYFLFFHMFLIFVRVRASFL